MLKKIFFVFALVLVLFSFSACDLFKEKEVVEHRDDSFFGESKICIQSDSYKLELKFMSWYGSNPKEIVLSEWRKQSDEASFSKEPTVMYYGTCEFKWYDRLFAERVDITEYVYLFCTALNFEKYTASDGSNETYEKNLDLYSGSFDAMCSSNFVQNYINNDSRRWWRYAEAGKKAGVTLYKTKLQGYTDKTSGLINFKEEWIVKN